MTDRIRRMRQRWETSTYPLCIDRIRASIPVMEAMKGEHPYKVRSAVHEAILTKCPIAIEPDDLICGVGASKAFGIEMDYEMGLWNKEELDSLKSEGYTIEPEEEEELLAYMDKISKGDIFVTSSKLTGDFLGDDPEMWAFLRSGLTLPPWKDKKNASGGGRAQSGMGLNPMGLFVADFEVILHRGARDIINECRQHIKDLSYFDEDCVRKKYFWQACITDLEALIKYANRYAELADSTADGEADPVRQQELRQMAEICRRVPEYPADSFREALQCFWFLFLMMNPSSTAAAGRFDQYMYPYYKKDIESGKITDDEVLELLDILRLKDFQLNRVSGKILREKNSGMAKWHNWTLGGVTPDGDCAVNELTYLEFRAAMDVPTPHHTITLRVAENTPIETIVEGLKVVKTGIGMPCFVGDKSYINFFLSRGVPIEKARNYSMAGCVDGYIANATRGQVAAMFIVTLVYDIFLHNGYCPWIKDQVGIKTGEVTSFKTFEEYKEGFYRQLKYLVEMAAKYFFARITLTRDLTPDFLRSIMTPGCLEEGKEVLSIHMKPYDALTVCSAVGVVNVADSLTAVKKLVYDEKKYTMEQLQTALEANWQGYEDMRQDFLKAPKYGNNEEEPDRMVAEVYDRYAEYLSSCDSACGDKCVPNAISITAHQPGGKSVGATPDGRFAGEILADAATSPAQGRDHVGPLAVFQSAMKVDQDKYQAMLMNMKFSPTAMKSDEDLVKLAQMIKIYLTNGGKHIQFNVVTKETLLAARKEPQKHKDLIVRVAGYSAYYISLSDVMQREVLDRTTYESI
ncbi:MAG: hypothetical protein II164_03010 [Firmicutes bacterium]|nr:hypothetical protein [Bacillota bacterium]MBQ2042620.1 hypothetical protein [Bacillota bacterium]